MTEKDNRPFDMLRFKADTLFNPEMGDLVASQAQAELEVLQEDPEGNAAELAVIKPMLDAKKNNAKAYLRGGQWNHYV